MDNENTNDIDLATLPAWKCVEILTEHPEQADKCDWTKFSLSVLSALFAKRPEFRATAKEKRGTTNKICCIAVIPKKTPYELARSVLKRGEVPTYDPWGVIGADTSVNVSDVHADGMPGGTKLIVRLDGEALVEQEIDFSDPHGLSFVDKGDLFDETPPKRGRWLYGANPREDVRWKVWAFEVPDDFAFDPEKLVIPFVRARTCALDEPRLWIHPCDIRYGNQTPGDDGKGFEACFHGYNEGHGGISYWTVENGVPEEYAGPWHCDDGEEDIDDDLYPDGTTFPDDD